MSCFFDIIKAKLGLLLGKTKSIAYLSLTMSKAKILTKYECLISNDKIILFLVLKVTDYLLVREMFFFEKK